MKFESLHNHTTDSDGALSHIDLLRAAERHGIGVMAITDHDALPDHETLRELKAYSGPVKWLSGIELSVLAPADSGGASEGFMHLLGLFTDPQNPALLDRCRQIEVGRYQRMKAYLEHFRQLGFKVTESDVLAEATAGNVGSPHMVTAVYKYPANVAIIEQLLKEFLAEAEHNQAWAELKADLDKGGERQIPYALFMRKNSFRPAPDTIEAAIDADEGVRLIRQAGGAAFMAHWYFDKTKMPLEYLAGMLRDKRLDGVGTYIFNAVNSYDTVPEAEMLAELAIKYDAATVIGSDAHSEADLEVFAANPKAVLSSGQTERLVERFRPDLRFSNLSA